MNSLGIFPCGGAIATIAAIVLLPRLLPLGLEILFASSPPSRHGFMLIAKRPGGNESGGPEAARFPNSYFFFGCFGFFFSFFGDLSLPISITSSRLQVFEKIPESERFSKLTSPEPAGNRRPAG